MSPAETCAGCKHAEHGGFQCPNMASDNDCSCDLRPTAPVPALLVVDSREALAQALHDVMLPGFAGVKLAPSSIWHTHADHLLSSGVVEEREAPEWPSIHDLADAHARYHDQPGNLIYENGCGWERCEFWDSCTTLLAERGGGSRG